MTRILDRQRDTSNAVIIERPQGVKGSRARLARNRLLRPFQNGRRLLEDMDAHAVGSTVPLGRAGKGTAFEGAFIACRLRCSRMPPFPRHSFDVMLQGLFLHKDLVAPLALVLPSCIMFVHVHTHGRLIRRGILGTLRTDIETLGRTDIRATNQFLSCGHYGYCRRLGYLLEQTLDSSIFLAANKKSKGSIEP